MNIPVKFGGCAGRFLISAPGPIGPADEVTVSSRQTGVNHRGLKADGDAGT